MKQENPSLLTGNLRRSRSCWTKCKSHLLPLLLAVCALFVMLQNAGAQTAADYFNDGTPIGSIYNSFTPAELNAGGYSFNQIIGAANPGDYQAIKNAGATARDFMTASVSISFVFQLYTPTELYDSGTGYTFGEIIGGAGGMDEHYADIKIAGATAGDFKAATISVSDVYSLYSPTDLRGGGYSFVEIIGASDGTDYSAIKDALATASDFYAANILVSDVYSLYSPTDLRGGGYSFGDIIGASNPADYEAIKIAGATATDFYDATISVSDVYSL